MTVKLDIPALVEDAAKLLAGSLWDEAAPGAPTVLLMREYFTDIATRLVGCAVGKSMQEACDAWMDSEFPDGHIDGPPAFGAYSDGFAHGYVAAVAALRSPTTALEIGRAMGMSQAAEICEEAAERCRTNEREQYGRGNGGGADIWAIRAVASEQRATAIRSTAHTVDLEGLTERIAQILAETEDSLPVTMATYRYQATVVLSSLGLRARESA